MWHECQHLEEIRSSSRFKLIANLLKKLRWFIFRLKSRIICNISNKKIDSQDIANIISELQLLFYKTRHAELQSEIKNIEKYLSTKNSEELTKQICDISMQYLKNSLFHRYGSNRTKPIFTSDDLKNNWQKVQEEYPVVLSTTFSSLTSLHKDATYDYLIMDEASQISVETGALAISHAQNVIIVGDSMQLSNIVKKRRQI
ncbi:AAA domain-containing protein [Bacteroides thetaiotaomicron]|uniref:AAA domain-containing protein n=1 Tax=Bacteroides thetaiotaomicron TaxID=818 RepID=UPI0021D41CA7|nr:AAA domain-containing protein [Bacteroides thetaiotaomicron]